MAIFHNLSKYTQNKNAEKIIPLKTEKINLLIRIEGCHLDAYRVKKKKWGNFIKETNILIKKILVHPPNLFHFNKRSY